MAEPKINVLIADDHQVVRKGVRALLEAGTGIAVVGEASDGIEAVEQALRLKPDVILMDLVMPKLDGVQAIAQIRAQDAEARILVLTSFGSDNKLFPALKAGALGYLLKDASPEELLLAIRKTAEGESSLTPAIARRLLREFAGDREKAPSAELLTDREGEILKQLARGLTNGEIADRLYISDATVRTHVSNILAKLNLANRTQAALYALRIGLISLDEIGSSQ